MRWYIPGQCFLWHRYFQKDLSTVCRVDVDFAVSASSMAHLPVKSAMAAASQQMCYVSKEERVWRSLETGCVHTGATFVENEPPAPFPGGPPAWLEEGLSRVKCTKGGRISQYSYSTEIRTAADMAADTSRSIQSSPFGMQTHCMPLLGSTIYTLLVPTYRPLAHACSMTYGA